MALSKIDTAAIAADAVTSGILPAGSVVQVKQTTVTVSTATSTSTSWADITGMSVSITPTSTSNKILVIVDLQAFMQNAKGGFRVLRGTTPLARSTDAGNRAATAGTTYDNGSGAYSQPGTTKHFLDSPSSTSAQTYKVQWITNGGANYLNRSANNDNITDRARTISVITVMEIAG